MNILKTAAKVHKKIDLRMLRTWMKKVNGFAQKLTVEVGVYFCG